MSIILSQSIDNTSLYYALLYNDRISSASQEIIASTIHVLSTNANLSSTNGYDLRISNILLRISLSTIYLRILAQLPN